MSPSYRSQRRTLHEQNDNAWIQVLVVLNTWLFKNETKVKKEIFFYVSWGMLGK